MNSENIKKHFEDCEVGDVDSLPVYLDCVKIAIDALKESYYAMIFMTTHGTLEQVFENNKRTHHEKLSKRQATFQHTELVLKHFNHNDSVDAHNSSRMDPISLEDISKTIRWPVRVFTFLLDITEVNF